MSADLFIYLTLAIIGLIGLIREEGTLLNKIDSAHTNPNNKTSGITPFAQPLQEASSQSVESLNDKRPVNPLGDIYDII